MSDGRLRVVLLAHVAGAVETGMHKETWRTDHRRCPAIAVPRRVRLHLAEIERQIIDAADQRSDGAAELARQDTVPPPTWMTRMPHPHHDHTGVVPISSGDGPAPPLTPPS